MIKLYFETLDGIRKTKSFKSLKGAQKATWGWVGKDAEIGSYYAVSADGVVKVTIMEGTTLAELFDNAPPVDPYPDGKDYYVVRIDGDLIAKTFEYREDADQYIYNSGGGYGDVTYDKDDGSIGVIHYDVEHWRNEDGNQVRVMPPPPVQQTNDEEIPF